MDTVNNKRQLEKLTFILIIITYSDLIIVSEKHQEGIVNRFINNKFLLYLQKCSCKNLQTFSFYFRIFFQCNYFHISSASLSNLLCFYQAGIFN